MKIAWFVLSVVGAVVIIIVAAPILLWLGRATRPPID